MNDDVKRAILRLRILVGYLGERAQFGWWPTAFYEPSSRLFLEPVFSKTFSVAQYHGVIEAARRLHDEHLSAGSYHLFRLPEELEQDLHAMAQAMSSESPAGDAIQSKERALSALQAMASTAVPAAVGPTAIGNIREVDFAEALGVIAGIYLSAFSHDTKSYPYVVG